jgi:hypothetical protein
MANTRVGEPWGHHFAFNRFSDGWRPCPRLLVGHQGHRRNFAGTVTTLAVILEYRKYVFVESGLRLITLTKCDTEADGDKDEDKRTEPTNQLAETKSHHTSLRRGGISMLSACRLIFPERR